MSFNGGLLMMTLFMVHVQICTSIHPMYAHLDGSIIQHIYVIYMPVAINDISLPIIDPLSKYALAIPHH